jgi:hypothetical protein
MPLIQGHHNGRAAVIPVAIIDVAKYREHKISNASIFKGAKPFHALIDTGATSTMISPRVVAALGLEQVNQIKFGGLDGLSWRPAYLFHVGFYETPPVDVNDVSNIRICRKAINGGGLSDEHTFDVLLGMDVLTTGNLHVDRDGTFKFTF